MNTIYFFIALHSIVVTSTIFGAAAASASLSTPARPLTDEAQQRLNNQLLYSIEKHPLARIKEAVEAGATINALGPLGESNAFIYGCIYTRLDAMLYFLDNVPSIRGIPVHPRYDIHQALEESSHHQESKSLYS